MGLRSNVEHLRFYGRAIVSNKLNLVQARQRIKELEETVKKIEDCCKNRMGISRLYMPDNVHLIGFKGTLEEILTITGSEDDEEDIHKKTAFFEVEFNDGFKTIVKEITYHRAVVVAAYDRLQAIVGSDGKSTVEKCHRMPDRPNA